MLPVQSYINHFIGIWENSPSEMPAFKREFSLNEKIIRENNFEKFQHKIKELQSLKNVHQFKKNPGKSFFPMFKEFLKTVFDFEKEHLSIILSDEFKSVSKDFFNKDWSTSIKMAMDNFR